MRPNNFDLLRLIAALSVVFFHTVHRLDINSVENLTKLFQHIPGVPIFFFISGFLISSSYSRSSSIMHYAKNRILRIYPALYVCLFLSIVSVIYIGYLNINIIYTKDFFLWLIAQMSFIQFYNPEFLRGYGVGALNGSLWTISVELQFYVLVPILYKVFTADNKNKILITLILIFSTLNFIFVSFNDVPFHDQSMLYKLFQVSFIPWFYMFLIGVLFQENFDKLKFLYNANGLVKVIYIFIVLLIYDKVGMNPITFFLYATVIFIFVFTLKNISQKILNGNDYSYGIYIYHAVIINYFVYKGYTGDLVYLLLIFLMSFTFAFLSWHILEKSILKYKSAK